MSSPPSLSPSLTLSLLPWLPCRPAASWCTAGGPSLAPRFRQRAGVLSSSGWRTNEAKLNTAFEALKRGPTRSCSRYTISRYSTALYCTVLYWVLYELLQWLLYGLLHASSVVRWRLALL